MPIDASIRTRRLQKCRQNGAGDHPSPRSVFARKGDCLQSDDQDGDIDQPDALGDLADDQRRQLGLRDARSSSNAGANDGSRRVLLAWRAAAAAGAAGGAIIAAPASEV
jgi:hypothetical protein